MIVTYKASKLVRASKALPTSGLNRVKTIRSNLLTSQYFIYDNIRVKEIVFLF
jgi:hypothetical protein